MHDIRYLSICFVALASFAGCMVGDPNSNVRAAAAAAVDPSAFVLPSLSAAERAQIVQNYASLDPNSEIPRGLLEDTIVYFDVNKWLIPQTSYFVVVDFSQYSGQDRFWLVDLTTGDVEAHKVAHGAGSDPQNQGYATLFGDVSGSYKTSLGFYLTGEIYDGKHPHSMRLDGLSPDGSPNGMGDTNARTRLIVMHEASYVHDSNTSQQGRSDGCLALDSSIEASVVDRIYDGSLIYAATSPLNPPVGTGSGSGTGTGSGTGSGSGSDTGSGSGSGAGGGSDTGTGSGSANDGTSCYSPTLGQVVPDNTCVQSDIDSLWYQCAAGSWVDRWTDPDPCNGVYPL
jgi:hypothetical protein